MLIIIHTIAQVVANATVVFTGCVLVADGFRNREVEAVACGCALIALILVLVVTQL